MGNCSVIVVAKNGGKLLFATIESVLQQDKLSELIIADNGNSPDVMSRLQQRSLSDPRLKVVPSRSEPNYAKASNFASRSATGDYLLLLKSGYLLAPAALSELISPLENEKQAMLTTGLVQDYDGSYPVIPRHRVATPKTIFLNMFNVKKAQSKAHSFVPPEKPYEVATASSACMCIRMSDHKKLGGLDADFNPQDEELDLTLRVQQIGGRVLCVPSVRVTRLPDTSIGKISVAKKSAVARNDIRYLNKFFARNHFFITLLILNILIMIRLAFKIAVCGIGEFIGEGRDNVNDVKAKRLLILALGTVDIQKNEKLAKKIVLVTGATSQVGLFVVRRLIASGAAVLAVSRDDNIPYHHPNLRWIKGDMRDPAFNLSGYCVDIVVHCAHLWLLPPVLDMLNNAEAKRIIAFSSTSVFANTLTANSFEKDLVMELSNAENMVASKCTALGLPYTILRPSSIYGIGLDSGVTSIANIIRRTSAIMVYPPAIGRRQPVHVEDLSLAVIQAVDNPASYNKSYNLSGGEVLTYREMLEKLFTLYKKRPQIFSSTALPFILDVTGKILRKKHINGEIARRMNDDQVFFNDDAVRDFGYNPRKFLTGGVKDVEGF